MEGLSIEEKAKAYDEAIKRAKSIIKITANQDEAIGFANTIFPELAESEDEKTREELITHCRNIKCVTKEGAEKIAKWIAWLEKQGEQKSDWSEEDTFMYNKIKNLLTDISLAPESRNSLFDWLKSLKQKIQS